MILRTTKIGNEILERIGTDCTNKYFKFVGLKIDEFLNWDYQIEYVSNKIASSSFALNHQIKKHFTIKHSSHGVCLYINIWFGNFFKIRTISRAGA